MEVGLANRDQRLMVPSSAEVLQPEQVSAAKILVLSH